MEDVSFSFIPYTLLPTLCYCYSLCSQPLRILGPSTCNMEVTESHLLTYVHVFKILGDSSYILGILTNS